MQVSNISFIGVCQSSHITASESRVELVGPLTDAHPQCMVSSPVCSLSLEFSGVSALSQPVADPAALPKALSIAPFDSLRRKELLHRYTTPYLLSLP